MIRIFNSTDTKFVSNGLGVLNDAISCDVVEERNGLFELEMEYPISGINFDKLILRNIIVSKSNPFSDYQGFRIYKITKPINGVVTVYAAHVSYDMSGIPVRPFSSENVPPQSVFDAFKTYAAVPCPFTFYTDKVNQASYRLDVPTSMRSLLAGNEGSILDVYGTAEYEFDNWKVNLWLHRGEDRNVSIEYGKNLTDLNQEEDAGPLYTGIYAYWSGTEYIENSENYETREVLVESGIVNIPGTYNYTNILTLDFTSEYDNPPSQSELISKCNKYIEDNDLGKPKVSLDISFIELEKAKEYETIQVLERVHLCDTVHVRYPKLGVSATAKCIKTTYNVITDKYESLELGNARSNLPSGIADLGSGLNDYYNELKSNIHNVSTVFQMSIQEATEAIKTGLGGHVMLRDSSGGTKFDELLIMDTEDIRTARKVWRYNINGWGYSSTGYNGTFRLAATMDGKINADFITVGTMMADRIYGGVLKLGGLNNQNGLLNILNSSGQITGKWTNDSLIIRNGADDSYNSYRERYCKIKEGQLIFGYRRYGIDNDTAHINYVYYSNDITGEFSDSLYIACENLIDITANNIVIEGINSLRLHSRNNIIVNGDSLKSEYRSFCNMWFSHNLEVLTPDGTATIPIYYMTSDENNVTTGGWFWVS